MKVERKTLLRRKYDIEYLGDKAYIRFYDNVKINNIEGEESYAYDEYIFTAECREGLEESIEAKFDEWLDTARKIEYKSKADEIREIRNSLLKASDWTQSSDAPLSDYEQKQWRDYRRALRDITVQVGFPFDVHFPAEPK